MGAWWNSALGHMILISKDQTGGGNIAGCELRGQELGNRAVVAKPPSPRGPEERVNIYFRYGTASLVCRRKVLEWGRVEALFLLGSFFWWSSFCLILEMGFRLEKSDSPNASL